MIQNSIEKFRLVWKTIDRLNSEKFQNFTFQIELVIFEWKKTKMITRVNSRIFTNFPYFRYGKIQEKTEKSPLLFSLKNGNLGLKMKILKFHGSQPTYSLKVDESSKVCQTHDGPSSMFSDYRTLFLYLAK